MNPTRWRRLSHSLDTLLELGEEERARYLARLARRAPDLANELRAALRAHREAIKANFLEGGALCSAVPSLQGRKVGRCTVERLLGSGPGAEVWLARYSDNTATRRVALKLLNRRVSAVCDVQRLTTEVLKLSRLSHPNIVPLLDGGVWNNRPYLVMEYMAGIPIDTWCDALRLSVSSRIALFMDVLDAVEYAHEKAVVHGNLKPANIMVTADGCVKIMDLGVVRMIEPMPSQVCAQLSDAARLVFAPTYAAPEQLMGGTLTPGTDVYALGTLLHALLVGVHPLCEPFAEESAPCKASQAALQISQDIAARRGSTPQQMARELRGGLDRIIAKASKHRPRGRYGNVEAFARRLRPYAGGAPIKERHGIIRWLLGRLLPCAQKDFADGQ
jgi:serine/threonine protein kinase